MKLQEVMGRLPRANLAPLPTPITRLYNTENRLQYRKLYLKRDDLTGLGAGGNKVRSLEYLIGHAMEQGCDTLVASGQDQSNLCALTAAAAARADMGCVLIHNSPKPDANRGNRLLNHILGVETIFLDNTPQAEREQFAQNYCRQLSAKGRRPYLIENGATTGRGALGYVHAMLELVKQRKEQDLSIRHLFAPGGNGGIAAGLIYGNALLGFPFKLHIISVEDTAAVLSAHISDTIHQIEAITGLPFSHTLDQAADINDAYRGEGWAIPTQESQAEVLRFARDEGIFIEHVYTAKLMVGFTDYLKSGKIDADACAIHTGGFGALFAQYP